MIVVHRNKVTELFVKESVGLVEDADYSICNNESEIDEIYNGKSMYYDLVFIEVNISYDYKRINSLIKKENDEIKFILMFNELDNYRKCILMLKKKKVDYKGISIKSIKEGLVQNYLINIFNGQYNLKLKNTIIKTIYKYLLYKSDVNKEISKLSSLRTETKIKKYINDASKISPSTFAKSLLFPRDKQKVMRYILDNSSLNYLMTILSNYTDNCIKTYELMYKNGITKQSAGEYFISDDKISSSKRYLQFLEEIDTCEKLGYRRLYNLSKACNEANTKYKKQRLLLELII